MRPLGEASGSRTWPAGHVDCEAAPSSPQGDVQHNIVIALPSANPSLHLTCCNWVLHALRRHSAMQKSAAGIG